jgi:predicted acetyltransferase
MGWAIRGAGADDIPALVRAVWAAFGNQPDDAMIETSTGFLEVERALVVEDAGRVVAGGANVSLELTVPGPATVPAAGVTQVGVLPTHRRQGILTAVMARLADDARRRGEPVAALLASESTIYRRFGYGVGTWNTMVEIERARAVLRRPPVVGGQARMLDGEEMAAALPPLFDRYRRGQHGEVSRTPGWWARQLRDHEGWRGGGSERFAAVWEDDAGAPEGYVTYRMHPTWEGGLPGHTLAVENLIALSPEVRGALWQYCFGVDLVAVVRAGNLAADDPLRWMLVDSRRLRVTAVNDFLWVRLLDVETALAARSYAVDDRLVIEVVDGFDAAVAGRYRLAGGDCRRTDDAADLTLDAADLASAWLGGARFATLARAGLVVEHTAGAVARADALFAVATAPASSTGF